MTNEVFYVAEMIGYDGWKSEYKRLSPYFKSKESARKHMIMCYPKEKYTGEWPEISIKEETIEIYD